MERVSELILRNLDQLGSGGILLINPPRDNCFSRLAQGGRKVQIFTQSFGDFQWFSECEAEVEFGSIPCPSSQIETIILIQPRERDRLKMLLHAVSASMLPSSSLWLAGEIKAGIKSAGKQLDPYFDSSHKTDNARHCVLYQASDPRQLKPFSLASYEKSWSLPADQGKVNLKSLPGTFAYGKLDSGTRLLLETLVEQKLSGNILDFACGNGVIGLFLLSQNPDLGMTLLDNSSLAVDSARRSIESSGLNATVIASDGLSQVCETYDWIISNPPFHSGVSSDLDIARKFFSEAGKFLTKEGKILLVCNHHLPYLAWLKLDFKRVETIRANSEFKIIRAASPRN